MAFSLYCAGPAAQVRPASVPETTVRISAPEGATAEGVTPEGVAVQGATPEGVAPEGEAVEIRISRDTVEGDLFVVLGVGGDAEVAKDYAVRGAQSTWTTDMRVAIPDGQPSVDLTVEVLDDVSAEADEAIILTLKPGEGYRIDETASREQFRIPQNDFVVTTTADTGEGSLRQAIVNAEELKDPDTITFDSTTGPFATPQTIVLTSELPDLTGDLAIDGYIPDRLWESTGVTVSGANQVRVFTVIPGARVTISSLTIAEGHAQDGGGILNQGELVVKGVTFVGNAAEQYGGGLANLGGKVTVINSTFADNRSAYAGGGLADDAGEVTVTNCTFSDNQASNGGGLFSSGTLLLRNTILANSEDGSDCVSVGALDPASTNNLIEACKGCGEPISSADPLLKPLGGYHGPTHTLPLGGGSPAVNLGDNASAVDQYGEPLTWDQRGNGDPRFVTGITDIGAYEKQTVARLVVDTFEDTELRGCGPGGPADCSLRGAITLANASDRLTVITFDPRVFAVPKTILLEHPLPEIKTDMTIDASGTAGVTVTSNGRFPVLSIDPEAQVELIDIDTNGE